MKVHTAKTTLSQLLTRVEAGEEIILARGKQPIAKIVPFHPEPAPRVTNTMLGKMGVSPCYLRVFIATLLLLSGWPVVGGSSSFAAQATIGNGIANDHFMTEDRFWALIDITSIYEAEPHRQLEALRRALRELTASEIEAFERAFQREQKRAYTWDLWGAAYLMNGGASDDGFEYFQRWLISKGRKVFDAAVGNPDSLAELVAPSTPGTYEFEEFAYVAGSVWEEKTGINPWKDAKGSYPYTGAPPASQLAGTPFEESKTFLAHKYPKLWARFGSSWL